MDIVGRAPVEGCFASNLSAFVENYTVIQTHMTPSKFLVFLFTLIPLLCRAVTMGEVSEDATMSVQHLNTSQYNALSNPRFFLTAAVSPDQNDSLWRYNIRYDTYDITNIRRVYEVQQITCRAYGSQYGTAIINGSPVTGIITPTCSVWYDGKNYPFTGGNTVETPREPHNVRQVDINAWLTINGIRVPPGSYITDTKGKVWVEGKITIQPPGTSGAGRIYVDSYKFDFSGPEQPDRLTQINYKLLYPRQIDITEKGTPYPLEVSTAVTVDGTDIARDVYVKLRVFNDNCGMGADTSQIRLGVWGPDGSELTPDSYVPIRQKFKGTVIVERAPPGSHLCQLRLTADFP